MPHRVLVVEDEPLLALDLESELSAAGFDVVGPAASVARALGLIDELGCDTALLDVNLGLETSEAVALALRARGTPFVVMSGYAQDELPAALIAAPFVSKPVKSADLLLAFRQLFSGAKRL